MRSRGILQSPSNFAPSASTGFGVLTCRPKDAHERIFIYEPRMGDAEEIEIDEAGRIIRIVDNTGHRIALKSYAAG